VDDDRPSNWIAAAAAASPRPLISSEEERKKDELSFFPSLWLTSLPNVKAKVNGGESCE